VTETKTAPSPATRYVVDRHDPTNEPTVGALPERFTLYRLDEFKARHEVDEFGSCRAAHDAAHARGWKACDVIPPRGYRDMAHDCGLCGDGQLFRWEEIRRAQVADLPEIDVLRVYRKCSSCGEEFVSMKDPDWRKEARDNALAVLGLPETARPRPIRLIDNAEDAT